MNIPHCTRFPRDTAPKRAAPGRTALRVTTAALGLAALTLCASMASANDVSVTISCKEVTFNAVFFPDAPGNTINETVFVDGVQVVATQLIFDGPSGSNTVSLNIPFGDHDITANAMWNTNGASGTFSQSQHVSCGTPPPPQCEVIGSIEAGFNGTNIVGVGTGPAFIWFNSNLSLKNQSAGTTITLTGSQVTINGTPYAVPDAKITFAAVACASTQFDAGSNTWLTTVPLAGSDEIFLSGLAFPVNSLPGGAKVTWSGNFGSSQPGLCLSWKWGAAAYTFFTTSSTSPLVIDYNAANIKPSHSAACGINNGDHAGTPQTQAIRASVTGGARGGGGSNFTGSWSGTGSLCPICPTAAGAVAQRRATPQSQTAVPKVLSFAVPRPNPASGAAVLNFTLPHDAAVTIDVYDVSGRNVRTVARGMFPAGANSASWNLADREGRPVAGGMYFLRLATEGKVLSHPLIVAR